MYWIIGTHSISGIHVCLVKEKKHRETLAKHSNMKWSADEEAFPGTRHCFFVVMYEDRSHYYCYLFKKDKGWQKRLNIVLFLPDTIPIGNTIPTSVLMVYLQPEMITIFWIPTLKTPKPLGHLLGTVAVVKQLL